MVKGQFDYDVTIVVPVYNGAKFVGQCFQSILGQKTEHSIQVVFVNDGSTDSSEEVIKELMSEYSNVDLAIQENQGLGPARNTGIEYAAGKYIAFLDVDDHLKEGHIDRLFQEAEEHDCDICFGGYTISRNGIETEYPNYYAGKCFDLSDIHVYYEKIYGSSPSEKVEDLVPVSSCFGLYSTSFLRTSGVEFLPILSEDTVFNAELAPKAAKIFCSSETGYVYSMDNLQSITRKYDPRKKEKLSVYFSELIRVATETEEETGRTDLVLRAQRKIISNVRGYIIFICGQRQLNSRDRNAEIQDLLEKPVVIQALDSYPVERLDFKYGLFARLMRSREISLLIAFSKLACLLKNRRG